MCVRSFEPLARKIVQVLIVLSREPVEGDRLVKAGLGVFANMAILVKYALATRLLPITVKALFDAWLAFAEVEGLFEGFDLVFVEFSRGIVRFFQALVCHPLLVHLLRPIIRIDLHGDCRGIFVLVGVANSSNSVF
jgi:hypothetical protein